MKLIKKGGVKMIRKFQKLLLVLVVILFLLVCGGCSTEGALVINSFDSSKIMPTTIFEIEIQKEYDIKEDYAFVIKYGHLYQLNKNDQCGANICLFQAHSFEDGESTSLNFDELISGVKIFKIDNFMSEKYNVDYELNNGKRENIIYNHEATVVIPKEIILNDSGVISLSLTTFDLDDNNQIIPSCEGSVIYLKYILEGNKIYFEKD